MTGSAVSLRRFSILAVLSICTAFAARAEPRVVMPDLSLIGSSPIPRSIQSMVVEGDLVYVAAGDNGLLIMNVRDPSLPHIAGAVLVPGYAERVFVHGRYAYLTYFSGLAIVDIRSSTRPRLIAAIECLEGPNDIVVSGRMAYVPTRTGELAIFDISTPGSPTRLASTPFGFTAWRVLTRQGLLVVLGSEFERGLVRTFDVSGTGVPVSLGECRLPRFPFNAVWKRGSLVDIVGTYPADSLLMTVDVANPAHPALVELHDAGGSRTLALAQSQIVLGSGERSHAILMFDVVAAGSHSQLALSIPAEGGTTAIAARGRLLFVTSNEAAFQVFQMPPALEATGVVDSDLSRIGYRYAEIHFRNSTALVSDETGIVPVDFSDRQHPSIGERFSLDRGIVYETAVVGQTALIAAGLAGLVLVDVVDPLSPRRVAALDGVGFVRAVAAWGSIAWIEAGGSLVGVDLTDPPHPRPRGRLPLRAIPRDFVLDPSAEVLWVLFESGELSAFDVADLDNPQELDDFSGFENPLELETGAGAVFVANGAGGVVILRLSGSLQIERIAIVESANEILSIGLEGALLLASEGRGFAVQAIDVSDPSQPRAVGRQSVPVDTLRHPVIESETLFGISNEGHLLAIRSDATIETLGGAALGGW